MLRFPVIYPLTVLLVAAAAVRAERPGQLARELDAEGDAGSAAVFCRQRALAEEDPQCAAQWFWFAAYEYAKAGQPERSDTLLARAEDAAPQTVELPAAWLHAENALRRRDWDAAAFFFGSLRDAAAEDIALRRFAARGAAAAYMNGRDIEAARLALAGDERLPAVERYAAGRDKRVWLGGALGLIPGCGYLYSGETGNALRSFFLNALFIWGMVETGRRDEWGAFSVIGFFEATWYSGSIYGGIDAARRSNRGRLEDAVRDVRGDDRLCPDPARIPVIALGFAF
jgi:hypothetical protein